MEANNPSGRTVVFDELDHSYTVKESSQNLKSVTTFIGEFFPKFDADKWAPRTAKKRGITTKEILAEWEEKAQRGRDEGHNVHAYAETRVIEVFRPQDIAPPIPKPLSDRCEELFEAVDRALEWLKMYYDFVEAEKIIFSPRLMLAGIIDLLMVNENGLTIFDWKQNREIKNFNPYQNALGPLKHLEDHDLNKYSLQLNSYRRILVEEEYYPSVADIDMKLIHLTPEGYFPINIKPMDKEITAMLKQHTGLFPDFF